MASRFPKSIRLLPLAVACCALPVVANAGDTFGRPVVRRAPGQADLTLVEGNATPTLVHVPAMVSKTQAALAAVTESQASGAQVVTLPYREHETYDVPLRPGMFTTFAVPADEPIQQFAVSNPAAVQLQVNPATNTAMLKLVQPMTVVGTIVTKKHIYYLSINPAVDGPWYQGVNWSFGQGAFGASTFDQGIYTSAAMPSTSAPAMGAPEGGDAGDDLFTGQPNFNYTVKGDAPFRPQAVWDNGRFTWVQFSKNIQELPALFAEGPNGLQIVNYTIHNNSTQILVNRLMPSFVLKLGKAEIHIKAER